MRNNSIKTTILAIFICLSLTVFFFTYNHSPTSSLKACRSQLVLIHDKFKLNMDFNFIFGSEKGSVTVNGAGYGLSGAFTIDRRIDFNYESEHGQIFLNSIAVHPYMGDSAEKGGANKHLPDFFFLNNTTLPLTIANDTMRHPVLLLGDTPLFLCE